MENEPYQALDTAIWAAAFLAHPYHHPTIGWRSDIETISIDRLQQFYNEFYWPDNATITVAGGFDTTDVLKQIKTAFGGLTKNPQPYPGMHTLEPIQQGERRVTIHRNGFNLFGSAYKMPSAAHPDIPALAILGLILMDGKTSRLHRALVDTNKATTVGGSWDGHMDPGLFQIWASISDGVPHAKVEESIQKEISKITDTPVTSAELKKAQISMRIAIASRRDGVYAFLESVNEAIAVGDWTQFVTLPEKYQNVTVKDVQRVARTYLVKDQSTVGWFISKS
ncbi:MAG: peptidase domain protein, partial [Parcubacteria group bacterium]|nr:peptidase domain protein [Parcubacteria group bacterium]